MFFPIPPWDGDEEEGDAPSAAGAAAAALSTEPAAAACGPSPSYPAAPPLAGSGASRTAKKRAAAHAVSLAALTAGVVPLGRLADREKEGAGAAGAAAGPADPAQAAKKARREEQRQAKAAATPARPAEDAAAAAAERKAAKKAARKAAKAAAEAAVATTAAPDPPTPPADAAPAATARPPSKKNKFKNGALAEVAAAVVPAAQEEEAPAPVPAPAAAAAPATNTTAAPAPAPARSKKVKPRQAAAAVLEPPTKDGNGEDQGAPAPAPARAPARAPPPAAAPSTSLARLRGSLAGGAFRWLNEALYTRSGADGAALIGGDPALFDQYHAGFRAATKGWPAQPVELAAAALRARFGGGGKPGGVAVADFGCGDAALANVHLKGAGFTVTSLDLVADPARGIIAANTASRVPLPPASQDAVVLCLALMGRDYPATLAEAARVLKPGGLLWVAEVRSRFAAGGRGEGRPGPSPAGSVDDTRAFVRAVTGRLGCVLASSPDATNKMFVVFEFQKQAGEGGQQKKAAAGKKGVWPALRPCEYKRR